MKQNRVIFVLLGVVLLLGVIFIIKLINNMPKDQPSLIIKSEIQKDKDEISGTEAKIIGDTFIFSVLGGMLYFYISLIVLIIFFIIGVTKLYLKLGVSVFAFKVIWISMALSILIWIATRIFIGSEVLAAFSFFISITVSVIIAIFSIIIALQFYEAIRLDFSNVIFLGIVPLIVAYVMGLIGVALLGFIVLSICEFVLHIMTMNKIANRLNKSSLYKVLLIIFPIIMMPVLGFQKQK